MVYRLMKGIIGRLQRAIYFQVAILHLTKKSTNLNFVMYSLKNHNMKFIQLLWTYGLAYVSKFIGR